MFTGRFPLCADVMVTSWSAWGSRPLWLRILCSSLRLRRSQFASMCGACWRPEVSACGCVCSCVLSCGLCSWLHGRPNRQPLMCCLSSAHIVSPTLRARLFGVCLPVLVACLCFYCVSCRCFDWVCSLRSLLVVATLSPIFALGVSSNGGLLFGASCVFAP